MRILMLDEDVRHMPHICDVLRQGDNDVLQVTDWTKLSAEIEQFRPEGIVVDLMIPAIGLPSEKCGSGYTTGAFLYKEVIHKYATGVPFIVFSASSIEISKIQQALNELQKYSEFKGVLSKGCDERLIIEYLKR